MMTVAEFHQRLLDKMECELAAAGDALSPAAREQMARTLLRIDRVQTRDDTEALCSELEGELRSMAEEETGVVCDPAVWLGAAECA